jgi:hypothetical protein
MDAPKKKTPLEELDAKHAADVAAFGKKIADATRDVADAETMLGDARRKLDELQRAQMNESFAYDTARARLSKPEAKAA